jgi:hypothetical protein
MAKSKRVKKAKVVDVKRLAAHDVELKPEAGAARAEGLALYKLAGRPTKAQFIMVYGERGHLMTWVQRAEAGIPAEQFQAALKKVSR